MRGRYEVRVPKEELDCVGDLRYCWRKLKRLAGEVGDRLAQLQPGFQRSLVAEVRAFVGDALAFRADWEAHGPTVPGLDPREATDRLRKFQQLFEVRGNGVEPRALMPAVLESSTALPLEREKSI